MGLWHLTVIPRGPLGRDDESSFQSFLGYIERSNLYVEAESREEARYKANRREFLAAPGWIYIPYVDYQYSGSPIEVDRARHARFISRLQRERRF